MKTKKLPVMFVVAGVMVLSASWSQAMGSLNFDLLKGRLTGGGGERSSTNHGVKDLTGQWYGGGISSGPDTAVHANFFSAAAPAAPAAVSLTPNDTLLACLPGEPVTVSVQDVSGLYSYALDVSYDAGLVAPAITFVDAFFDTSNAGEAVTAVTCAAGTCSISAAKVSPAPAVDGAGALLTIDLTPSGGGGDFNLSLSNISLSNSSGSPLSSTPPAGPLLVTTCGVATVQGVVSLQGRATPITEGSVTLVDQDGNLPPQASTYDAASGAFSFGPVYFLPGGSSYRLEANHALYLGNRLDLLLDETAYAAPNTRLLGGDATNDGSIDILDLGCIGAHFGNMGDCGGSGSSNINADNKTNIQDLSLTGGNYSKASFGQGW